MKTITLLLQVVIFQTAFSQNWDKVDFDENISISLHGEITRSQSGNNTMLKASTSAGDLTIQQIVAPNSIDIEPSEFFKEYPDDFLQGIKFSGFFEILEDSIEVREGMEIRIIVLRATNDKLLQLCFLTVHQKMYMLEFEEKIAPSDDIRKKIFSSIQIRK